MVDETVNDEHKESPDFTEAFGVREFANRLNAVRIHHGIRSTSAFARFLGIPNNSMRSYLKGENDPTREKLVQIATKCGVSLQWLATGEGQMEIGDSPPMAPGMSQVQSQSGFQPTPVGATPAEMPESLHSVIDFNLLVEANRMTMAAFSGRDVDPTAEQLTRIATVVYDTLVHAADPDKMPGGVNSVIDFSRLVEANRLTIEAFSKQGVRPTPERLTRIAIVVYDTLTNPAQPDDPWKIAKILTSPFAEQERQKNLKRLAQDDGLSIKYPGSLPTSESGDNL